MFNSEEVMLIKQGKIARAVILRKRRSNLSLRLAQKLYYMLKLETI